MSTINFAAIITAVVGGACLAIVIGVGRAMLRKLDDIKRDWGSKNADVDLIKEALIGAPETMWHREEPGLIADVRALKERLGTNGGTTVFENLTSIKHEQQHAREWSEKHLNQNNEAFQALNDANYNLRDALSANGIHWNPPSINQLIEPDGV